MHKKNVLFVCEKNTCRSQMAEGFSNTIYPELMNAFSAGISPSVAIDPLAIKVMDELGIDISNQETHAVKDFLQTDIDLVVTVCSTAAEKCPSFSEEVKVMCNAFDDPPVITKDFASEKEKLIVYRRVRDEIKYFVESLKDKIS